MIRRSSALWAVLLVAGCGDIEAPSPKLSEPQPHSIAPALGSTEGGQLVAIEGAGFTEGSAVLFDGVPATDVRVMSAAVITAVTPSHAEGPVTVRVYDSLGRVAELVDAYTYERTLDVEGRPRLVNAVSTSNTSVRVIFSEPVFDGADDVTNYAITHGNVNAESGKLLVLSATPSADGISVDLETSSQNEVIYELAATNLRDLDGNLLAPPELLLNPSVVDFAGTPPSASGTLVDTDADGLPDNFETGGWTVTLWLVNGDFTQVDVTSDPYLADTDGDGLDDASEYQAGSNPRLADTDGDGVSDAEEWNDWWADPTRQDTDEDGLADGSELLFGTSIILADTDGDGYEDYEELFELHREPLLADLPRPQIVVTSYDITLNVTSSYTDETGTVHAVESSSSTSVSQATATSLSRSDTRSTEVANTSSQDFGVEVGYSAKDGFAGSVSANFGFGQSRTQGYTSTVDTQTAKESQQSYERSVGEAFEQSESRSITREISSAQLLATVNVANASDVPFTIENLEITAMRQERGFQGGAFRPVATLSPSGGDELSLNLGPFDNERGPIIFANTDIFPNLVEELLREPNGLIFKVANFDVTDEEGRNFTYSSAAVNSRTAGVTIDAGDGRTRSYRVATHARFDASGRSHGITMTRALEMIGYSLIQNDAALPDPLPSPLPASIRNSVGTLVDDTGVERLVRVAAVQNDLGVASSEKRFWTIQTNNDRLDPDVDFTSIMLEAGQEYLLIYVRDIDQDQLFDREERMYGSSDESSDSDSDGIPDYEEVREGWTVAPVPGVAYRVFPSPARPDSDLDGLTDAEERILGTDPNRADTDMDGLSDKIEYLGGMTIYLFDGDADDTNNEIITLPSCDLASIGTCVPALDPLSRDTDIDGIPDGREVVIGTNPTVQDAGSITDSDGDGLFDDEETQGWDVVVDGVVRHVTSNPAVPDTDLDGIPDVYEFAIFSDPRSDDTDGDGLLDLDELDTNDTDNYYGSARLSDADYRCGASPSCVAPPASNGHRTNVWSSDSDGDGRTDPEEIQTPWTVQLAAPYQVYSLPYKADADVDGLDDAEELLLGTDPNVADTDGDGTSDGVELTITIGGTSRDPLTPDRRVTVEVVRVYAAGNCEWGGDDVDDGTTSENFDGGDDVWATDPQGVQHTIFNFNGCDGVEDDQDCSNDLAQYSTPATFFVEASDSFSFASQTFTDDDNPGPSGGFDETLSAIPAQSFTYSDISATSSLEETHTIEDIDTDGAGLDDTAWTDGRCEFELFFRISVN